MSFDAGFMLGLSMGGGGSKPEEDWTPPADWPVVPEPSDYEMYFLIDVSAVPQTFAFVTTEPTTANSGVGALSIDWGDGSISEFADNEWRTSNCTHEYNATGKYVVKVSTSKSSCFLQQINPTYANSILLAAKLGNEILLNNGSSYHTQAALCNQYYLQYVKFGGKGGLPRQNAFSGDYSLHKIDISTLPVVIPLGTFNGTYCLKKFDFSEAVEINNSGISSCGVEKLYLPKCKTIASGGIDNNYSLKKVDLPLCTLVGKNGLSNNMFLKEICLPSCTSIGDNGMNGNYSLEKITVAEGCSFGKNCFAYCYNLIPHPDGSTN